MSEQANFLVQLMSAGDCSEQVPDIKRVKWMSEHLQQLGCRCDYQVFADTANLYAEIGSRDAKKTLCFCGHCDVVPARNWTRNPAGEIVGDRVYGRGAVDMLGGVAGWFFALKTVANENTRQHGKLLQDVRITTLLTGDEEGAGTHGTQEMVEYLFNRGEKIDACIVGEPTSDYQQFGDYSEDIDDHKLDGLCYSRGGSLHFWVTVKGKSGHVAYVGEFDNPITKAVNLCDKLKQIDFAEFGKMTNLEIVSFHASNNTENVILDDVKIHGNVRFFVDTRELGEDIMKKKICVPDEANITGHIMFDARMGCDILQQKIQAVIDDVCGQNCDVKYQCDRFGYATDQSDDFIQLAMSCMKEYNDATKLVITRGCTDGEYMAKIAKSVCEIGLKCKMMHKIDEYTTIQDLEALTGIYTAIIKKFIQTNKSK